MKTRDAIAWFKTKFGPELENVVAGRRRSDFMLVQPSRNW